MLARSSGVLRTDWHFGSLLLQAGAAGLSSDELYPLEDVRDFLVVFCFIFPFRPKMFRKDGGH